MTMSLNYSLNILLKLENRVDNRQLICYDIAYCHSIPVSESSGYGEVIASSLS